jgi:hypothetical protein
VVETDGVAAPLFSQLSANWRAGLSAMVAEDFLQDPQIRDWLDGVELAWTLLTFESLQAAGIVKLATAEGDETLPGANVTAPSTKRTSAQRDLIRKHHGMAQPSGGGDGRRPRHRPSNGAPKAI